MKVVLQDFKYGRIMRIAGDYFIGDSIAIYGEYSDEEIAIYRVCVREGDYALDIGANIGACTIPLAQMVGKTGRVYAFEPQRIIHQILCGNVMLNNLMNVYIKNAGIGAKRGKIKINDLCANDETVVFNTGAFAIKDNPGDYELEIISVDDLHLTRCDFIKCDTEGMGLDMLKGARKTIQKFHPIMYIEQEAGEPGKVMVKFLSELGYRVYKHAVLLFRVNNYFSDTHDTFVLQAGGQTEYANYNWLCLPKTCDITVEGLEEELL